MKLRCDQLANHVSEPLRPIYLLSSDEPLQMMEGADAIRAAARKQGYTERELLEVDRRFDWDQLHSSTATMSLFAERRVVELRMTGNKFADGAAVLTEYAQHPPADDLLLITCGKLEKRQLLSKWCKAIDKVGVVVPIWPIEAARLPGWISQRMRARGLQPSAEAAALLAERVEGNLLAAAQEIDKLELLNSTGPIGVEEVESAVADSARYDIFKLADSALSGEGRRTLRIIEGLRAEGIEATLVLWSLAREIRSLLTMASQVARGTHIEQAMSAQRVWSNRQGLVRQGLTRHNERRWQVLLHRCGRVDRIIKGAEPGNPWDELIQLALLIAGVRII